MDYLDKAVVGTARWRGNLHVFIPLSSTTMYEDYRTICRYRGHYKDGIWSFVYSSIREARQYQAKICTNCERKLKELGQ
jgi:hypothetical protein